MNFLVEIRVAYPRRRKEFATRGQQAIPLLQARCNRIPFGEVRYYPVPVDITDGDGRVVGVNAQIEEALKILQSGNRQDAERALETLQGVVYGFGMKVCGSHEDAQDTAQETLIRLARQLRDFPDARALSVWLYKVAKTQCLMSRRKSKFAPVQMPSLEDLLPKDADLLIQGGKSKQITPEDILLNQELRDRLQEAILALPKHYRLVLILRDMEQLDTREVAEVMGISEETTKMRLHRARVSVRNALAGYFQDLKEGEKRSHA